MSEDRQLKLKIAQLERQLASEKRLRIEAEDRGRRAETVARSLITHFLYICLHWLQSREKAAIDGWRSRKAEQVVWFDFAENIFPPSRKELRDALNEYKRQLGIK